MQNNPIPTTPTTSHQPFPFLKLPQEIRLIIYDLLPIKTTHHALHAPPPSPSPRPTSMAQNFMIILVKKTLPSISLLSTCHTIHKEALPILTLKMKHLRTQPIQYIQQWETYSTIDYDIPGASKISRISEFACKFDPCWEVLDNYMPWEEYIRPFVEMCVAWEGRYRRVSRLRSVGKSVLFISRKGEYVEGEVSRGICYREDFREFQEEVLPRGRFKMEGRVRVDEFLHSPFSDVLDFPVTVVDEEAWRDDWEEGERVV